MWEWQYESPERLFIEMAGHNGVSIASAATESPLQMHSLIRIAGRANFGYAFRFGKALRCPHAARG